MKSTLVRLVLGVALVAGGLRVSSVLAQTEGKTLPTLLIKGDVVALDTNDPSAALLKVKDRYGFETPIFLTPETKILQGEEPVTAASLTEGTAVEVEYNFDINTAKRHAVSVKLPIPPEVGVEETVTDVVALASAEEPATEVAPAAESAAPAAETAETLEAVEAEVEATVEAMVNDAEQSEADAMVEEVTAEVLEAAEAATEEEVAP